MDYLINYDKDVNLLKFTSPNSSPLKVEYSGDVEIEVKGELNFVTKNNLMSFDSINSKIWLNSRMARSLRDTDRLESDEDIEIKKLNDQYTDEIHNIIPLLINRIYELEDRILQLENNKIPVIE